jgi:hypothetical protein
LFGTETTKGGPIVNNTFGVGMPHAGSARALHVVTAATGTHAALAAFASHAAAPAAAGIAPQRKRRTAAATNASVNGGTS